MEMNRAILRFALTGLVAALLAGSAPSWSQTPAPEAGAKAYALPAELLRAAKRWKVDLKDVTIAVLPVDDVRRTDKDSNVTRVRPVLLHRADVSVAPASSAKVVTTLVALETLGSHYRWYTGFYADEKAEPDAKGVLRSPLYIKGGGDPNFVLEAFDLELTRLREKGIRRIEGDVVVDRSFFDVPETNRNAFDGRGSRPYNLPPDAALVNYRNLSFEMTPDPEKGVAHIVMLPRLAGVTAPKTIALRKKGGCGDWKSALGYKLERRKDGTVRVRFTGALPAACGAKNFNVIGFEANEYLERLFRGLWTQKGGAWTGRVREGAVPENARRLLTHVSPDAGEVVRLVNKWSNNPMARHLFLTLGYAAVEKEALDQKIEVEEGKHHRAVRLDDARAVISAWLRDRGIDARHFYMENGSGLSRETRVTARLMAEVLAAGAQGPYAPEFMASLPITGEDGTMARRKVAVSWGRMKTGLLRDVRSIAGYVHAKSGKRYALYAGVNGKESLPGAQAFLDNVILWAYEH